jgi:hypothetical protein
MPNFVQRSQPVRVIVKTLAPGYKRVVPSTTDPPLLSTRRVSIMDSSDEEEALLIGQILMDEMAVDDAVIHSVMYGSSSDEEEGNEVKEKSPNKDRDFLGAYQSVVRNYFSGRDSKYDERDFERRFCCPREVFNRVHDALIGRDPFVHYLDVTKKPGIYPLVKLVGCFRYIAYGDAYDREDENLEISASALRVLVQRLCKLVIQEFGAQYLNRVPSLPEREAISRIMASRGV